MARSSRCDDSVYVVQVATKDEGWQTAGERLHLVTGRTRGGNLVFTACGLQIYLSALDRYLADPCICLPCKLIALQKAEDQ